MEAGRSLSGQSWQRAKKVVSDSPGLLDFATRLVIARRAGKGFWGIHCNQSCSSKKIFRVIESDSWASTF